MSASSAHYTPTCNPGPSLDGVAQSPGAGRGVLGYPQIYPGQCAGAGFLVRKRRCCFWHSHAKARRARTTVAGSVVAAAAAHAASPPLPWVTVCSCGTAWRPDQGSAGRFPATRGCPSSALAAAVWSRPQEGGFQPHCSSCWPGCQQLKRECGLPLMRLPRQKSVHWVEKPHQLATAGLLLLQTGSACMLYAPKTS